MNKKELKITQGEEKLERHIQDLIRNKDFLKKFKRLKRLQKKEQSLDDDFWNKEYANLIIEYKKLRKRSSRLINNDYWNLKMKISEIYRLDNYQINYIECLLDPDFFSAYLTTAKGNAENDMCKILETNEIEIFPSDNHQNLTYFNHRTQLFFNAYPIGIFIHPKASKRDVLDFIEKKWSKIENEYLRAIEEKKLKYGKRKHSQKLLDFIWSNKHLKSKDIKSDWMRNFLK
jgi:hypothetical protein